jgi:ABC-type glycerol-3-phosphate transport system permease component
MSKVSMKGAIPMATLSLGRGPFRRMSLGEFISWLLGIIVALLWIFPLYWMLITSIKPEREILSGIGLIPRNVTIEHYLAVFEKPIVTWFMNSVIVAAAVVVGSLVLGSLCGYALARLHFPGRDLIFWVLIASLMIPGEMTIVPLFIGTIRAGLTDTYWAFILPPLSSVFSVYLYRQFFLAFPPELEDAARIDGCSRIQAFWRVVLPLAQPATLAGAILIFTENWNSFLWPLLVAFKEEWRTLPVGTATFNTLNMQRTEGRFGFGPAMAAMTIVALPTVVFFLAMQRYFIQGITRVGLKG